NAIVWDLVDRSGCRRGQAATFASWQDVQAD
ncbi:MEKHLA domain-containing protein, partial [Rhizobium ruizarguesonis]